MSHDFWSSRTVALTPLERVMDLWTLGVVFFLTKRWCKLVQVEAHFVFLFLWVVLGFMVTLMFYYSLDDVGTATTDCTFQICHFLT